MATKIGASGLTVDSISSDTIYPRYLGEVLLGTPWIDTTGVLLSGPTRFQVDLYGASMQSTSIPYIQFQDENATALTHTGTVSNIGGTTASTYFSSTTGIPLVNTGVATHTWTGSIIVTGEGGRFVATWRLMASGAATPIRMSIGSAIMYSNGNYIKRIYFGRSNGTVTVRSYR